MPSFALVEGDAPVQAPAGEFLPTFERRVVDGLFAPGSRRRANYVITTTAADGIRFRAEDWATAAAIGLNEVDLSLAEGRVRYRVRYPRWAAFVLLLGAAIGLVLIGAFLALDLPSYIERNAASRVPGLSLRQNVALAWGFAIFFGFVWPWLLIALHRGQIRKTMRTLIAEVDRVAQLP
jgi:hypothetical protein